MGTRLTAASRPASIAATMPMYSGIGVNNSAPIVPVKYGPKLDRYTARPSTATAAVRYTGSLLGPSSALPNCWVGAANWVVGCAG